MTRREPDVAGPDASAGGAPARAGLVLLALILAAAVANLNLGVVGAAHQRADRELRLRRDG